MPTLTPPLKSEEESPCEKAAAPEKNFLQRLFQRD
jgi:hypothetical protein